jgi:hypothetical protein
MKIFRMRTPVFFLIVLIGVSGCATLRNRPVSILSAGPLRIEFPAKWSVDDVHYPLTGKGPNGEKLEVLMLGPPPGEETSEYTKSASQTLRKFVALKESSLKRAVGGYKILEPYKPFKVPDGHAAASSVIPIDDIESRPNAYIVQYIFADPGRVFMITFDGQGDAMSAKRRFDAILGSARWVEAK